MNAPQYSPRFKPWAMATEPITHDFNLAHDFNRGYMKTTPPSHNRFNGFKQQ
jgi:hypothetical protein